MPFRDRVSAVREALRERDADALVVYPGPNTRYLAGFVGEPLDRHLLLVVPATADPWFVTPRKSLDLVRDEGRFEPRHVIESNDPAAVADRLAAALPDGVERILLDDRTPFGVAGPLVAGTDATVDSAGALLEELRIEKDEEEIAALERSAAVADEVSEEIRAMGRDVLGTTESELAATIRARLHEKGGTRRSFDVVVASGPNAARPYRRHCDRAIRSGEPVVLDFGAFVDGYASDQTRTTVFAGDPPDGFEAAYDAVRAALSAAVDVVEPGVPAGEVDRVASGVVADRGFGDELVHATGHGVGLEAHESPAIADGDERPLRPGMVFSVEPGVYVEGKFGVRVEDLVVVTQDGCDRLNDSPRTWRPL